MKKLLLPIIAGLLLYSACGDDKNETLLLIGVKSDNVEIHTLNPPVQIYFGHPDSIDLDADLSYDLIFLQTMKAVETGFTPESWVSGRNQVQMVLSGINQYPDTLAYNTEINSRSHWSDTSEENRLLLGIERTGFIYNQIGNFFGFQEHYLGIRKESRLGWVKVKMNPDNAHLEVLEWAIMK